MTLPLSSHRPLRSALGAGLEVEGITVRFGGLVALDAVSFSAAMGRVTGLIGPNGAGKTTAFDVCSGLRRPAHGTVSLFGADVSRIGPAGRARRGLGRTFQRMQLFDSLTVAENVAMGREAAFAGSNLLRQLAGSRRERADIADAAGAAMEQCGLGPLAGRRVGGLSTGQRRLVELARALAGRFRFLLLDEPSSGLDHRETDEFGRILTEVVDGGALGILIVEHDMRLVMEVCDHLFVLDFGILLCDGSPAEIAASPQVRAAYLGEEG